MSNKIYQKVASLSITHIKSFFNMYGLFQKLPAGFMSWRVILVVMCLLLSICSMIMALLAIKAQEQPATIEIHCPKDFNETIEKVREEIESLKL